MKKTTVCSILFLVITMLTACLNRNSASDTFTSGEESTSAPNTEALSTDAATEELPDWLKEYVPALSNEEMMKYGYDENGGLVLTEDQLEHIEDTYIISTFDKMAYYDSSGMYEWFEEYHLKGEEAGMVLIGTVQTITSRCTRIVERSIASYDDKQIELQLARYEGYTETFFQITDVLDIHLGDSESTAQMQALKGALIGKTILLEQRSFWYIDEDGAQKKGRNHGGYTYVLKPDTPAVVWLHASLDVSEFAEMSVEEVLQTFDDLEWWINDYFPTVNENGEIIDTFEKFTSYLSYLEDLGLTYPTHDHRKTLHPKVSISY